MLQKQNDGIQIFLTEFQRISFQNFPRKYGGHFILTMKNVIREDQL